MVAALQEVLDYSRRMAAYANEDDLIQGLGHVSIGGGALDVEGKMKEVRAGAGLLIAFCAAMVVCAC